MINNYNKKNDYAQYVAQEDDTLLSWLLANLKESRSKVKATLQGRGIKVNGKQVTQFDFPIHKGDKISISRSKKNDQFKSRYLSIVYEDKYLVVIEKNVGILSLVILRSMSKQYWMIIFVVHANAALLMSSIDWTVIHLA